MKKEKIKINIMGKDCTARFNVNKLRFEHNFGYKDNNGVRQSRIITGTSIEELTKNIESFYNLISNQSIYNSNIKLENYIKFYCNDIAPLKNSLGTINSMMVVFKGLPTTLLNTPLNKITTQQLQVMYSNMNKRYADNTIKYTHQCINTILNYAVKTNLLQSNVNLDCIIPKAGNGKKIYIDTDEIITILDKIKNHKRFHILYRPVLLLAVSGIRCGECLGLKKDCIDKEKGLVYIQAQVVNFSGYTTKLKTLSSKRIIKLSKEVIDIITQYDNDSEFVFTTPRGLMWSPTNFHIFFRQAFDELGYPNITPKQFRNSFVKTAVRNNVSLKVIQNILGHSRISTTMDIYGELTSADTYNATKSICSKIVK